jgi:diacylglycerol kinase family enzyme
VAPPVGRRPAPSRLQLAHSVVFVINPAATRHLASLERRCHGAALNHGLNPIFWDRPSELDSHEHRTAALVRCVVDHGAELVVAVGGDGTVRVCAEAARLSGVALGILPTGAANLLAHALGVPFALEDGLATALQHHESPIDLAVSEELTSVVMAGVGLDAAVVGSTPPWLKRHLGWLGYALGGLSHVNDGLHEFEVRIDDAPPIHRRAHSVVVGNVGLLPGGFALLPHARPYDGMLDVGIVPSLSVGRWVQLGASLVTVGLQTHLLRRSTAVSPFSGLVETFRARHVEIVADKDLPRQADGEPIEPARSLCLHVEERSLRVRVPARAS